MTEIPPCANKITGVTKHSYRRSRDARKALRRAQIFGTVKRAYKCPLCGFYHLTSQKARP